MPQKVYPGLVPGQGSANGKLFTDLTDDEWATLDAFEDPTYTLAAVRVLAPLETDALAYIWRGEHVDQTWSTIEFGREELADYLDRCLSWRRHYVNSAVVSFVIRDLFQRLELALSEGVGSRVQNSTW